MFIFSLIICLFSLLAYPGPILAISDPLASTNNRLGIHILFPDEVPSASKLVNNQGLGSWGYVVIPIQTKDRDRNKWQDFFDKCLENKIIPIIRVATVPEGSSWVTPNDFDLVDFANFLNDLRWPVQNRYLIFFNEVNRADEYGGVVSPEDYADLLNKAIDLFKEKSPDFFILPAGLDNAASDRRNSINWQDYLWQMYRHQPEVFNKLDGWTSHAYPNPDFSARPNLSGTNKIDSFRSDLELIKKFTDKKLPVFITETGWSGKNLSDHQISLYYDYAFSRVWSDPNIVVIAPFLLSAQAGPFQQFSFMDAHNEPKEFALNFASHARKGDPSFPAEISPDVALAKSEIATPSAVLGVQTNSLSVLQKLYNSLKTLFGLFK